VEILLRVLSDCEELVGGKITAPLCSTSKNNVTRGYRENTAYTLFFGDLIYS